MEDARIKSNESPTPSTSPEEEIFRTRQSQLAALRRDHELKRRTVQALRRETEQRIDTFATAVDRERKPRRDDRWWPELIRTQQQQQQSTTPTERVRRVIEMCSSSPTKRLEAAKLKNELDERRRSLASARARLLQELANEELLEDIRPTAHLHLQDEDERSCAMCRQRDRAMANLRLYRSAMSASTNPPIDENRTDGENPGGSSGNNDVEYTLDLD